MKSYEYPIMGIEDMIPFSPGFTPNKVHAIVVTNRYQKYNDTIRFITLLLFRAYVDDDDKNHELIIMKILTANIQISS